MTTDGTYTGEYKFPLDKTPTQSINSDDHLLTVSTYVRKLITDLSSLCNMKRELRYLENSFSFHIPEKNDKLSLTNSKAIIYYFKIPK